MSYTLTIKHQEFTKSYELQSNVTSINNLRIIIRSISNIHKLEINNIKLEFEGNVIEYKSIETKLGLSKKAITLHELFNRGGKIFY